MRSLCYLALVALASLARVQPVESRDQSTIDNAVNYLSESFEELKKYGLGVEALQTEYNRITYFYSSLEDNFIEELSTMSDVLTVTEAIRDIVNAIGNIEPSCSSNEEPPLCSLSFGSSVTGCCYGCNDTMSSENANMFYCFADRQIRIAGSRLRDVEVLIGLEEEGQLLLFPPSTMNNYSDPRLMSWYSRSTLEPREVVIFLDINTNGLNGPSAVNELKDAAINLIESLEPRDKVGVIVTGNIRQRVCPGTFATEREKQELTTRLIRDELLTVNLDYIGAFQAASSYFNTSSTPSSNRYFIFLSDGRRTSFNGAQFLNISGVTNLIYTANNAVSNDLFSNQSVNMLSDIGEIWTPFRHYSNAIVLSTELNSKGVLYFSLTRGITRNEYSGVIAARLPWKQLLSAFDVALNQRPSSYYFLINRAGNFLYHSNYPNTSVLSIDPFVIEGNTTEFRYIRDSVMRGQNESMPFNNTVLVPSSNESYYMRYVPSTYHCQLIINRNTFAAFICFVLADEDQSFIDMFNIVGSSVSSIYSSDQSRLPIYQTTLSSLSNKCNYVCQYSSNANIVLQMTTPNAPPNSSFLLNFGDYISGTSQSTPSWLEDGISSEIAVHSAVSSVWLKNATNISAPIIRRYLTTPTGIFLSYPGINIDPSFTPRGLPWYPNALSFPDLLTLSYAQTDNTLYSNAQTYSISTALRVSRSPTRNFGNGVTISIVAADLTMESLNNSVYKSLGSFCTQSNNECIVLTSEGYFVLLPPDINQPTLPFHLTDHEPYNGITRTLLERGILVKEGCNVINDNTIIHRRFYSIRSVSSTMSCFIASRGCRDFCIKQITGTNSYLLISYRKSSCLSNVFSLCTTDCTDCTNTYSILSIECPCICGQTTCQIPSYGNLPVCPASSTLPPANYRTVLPDTTAGNGSFCFDDQCSKLSKSSCQSSLSCNWCSQQSICVPLGICCTGNTSCCSNFARYPSCIRNKCNLLGERDVHVTSTKFDYVSIAIGASAVGLIAFIALGLFILRCIWYQIYRKPDDKNPTKPTTPFAKIVDVSNKNAFELE